MSFWSGEYLAQVLPSLITDFHRDRIDCASYRLRLGDQAFITFDTSVGAKDALAPIIRKLTDAQVIQIEPGQFAFLLTLESVKVPDNAIAFISTRARYKFQGLMNVSGFHVDPGWEGHLLFGAYNAGPLPITLQRGEEIFLIVYGDLDRTTDRIYNGESKYQKDIQASLVSKMSGQVFSPIFLQRRIEELTKQIADQNEKLGTRIDDKTDAVGKDISGTSTELRKEISEIKTTVESRRWLTTVVITMTGAFLTAVLSLSASDTVKAIVGGWMSEAITLADKKAAERCALITCNAGSASTTRAATSDIASTPDQATKPLLPTKDARQDTNKKAMEREQGR